MSDSLRARTIRLAHVNPALRPHLLSVLAASDPPVGSTLTLMQMTATGAKRGDQFELLDVVHGFTRYGPNPEGTFYRVRSLATGKEEVLQDWYFKPGGPPKMREPLEEAFAYVVKALKTAKLFDLLSREKSAKRDGRKLQVAIGKPAPTMGAVRDALNAHPMIQMTGMKGVMRVQVEANKFAAYEVTLTASNFTSDPAAPFYFLELYFTL